MSLPTYICALLYGFTGKKATLEYTETNNCCLDRIIVMKMGYSTILLLYEREPRAKGVFSPCDTTHSHHSLPSNTDVKRERKAKKQQDK